LAVTTWPAARLQGQPTFRLIPSLFPPIAVFDLGLSAEEAAAAFELEAATNDRLVDVRGRLRALPSDAVATGAGAGFAMAAFLHGGPGRFNDAAMGAWYAALVLETAISEVAYHSARRLQASAAGFPAVMEMRELVSHPAVDLVDLRGAAGEHRTRIYDADDYTASQAVAGELRLGGALGLLYGSVRQAGGECVVLFRPRDCLPVVQGAHFRFGWDAQGALDVLRLSKPERGSEGRASAPPADLVPKPTG
jgi:RES domain-containing protein